VHEIGGLVAARQRFEAACITEALHAAGGNVSQAARMLGIDRTNLHKKIQAFGLATGRERGGGEGER
jgi:DNA-binding NtrC family response regulator